MLARGVGGVGVGVIAGLALFPIGCTRDNPEFGAVTAGGSGFGASDGATSGAASTSTVVSTGGPGEGPGAITEGADDSAVTTDDASDDGATSVLRTDTGDTNDCVDTELPCDGFEPGSCGDGFKCSPFSKTPAERLAGVRCLPAPGDALPGDECSADCFALSGYDECAVGAFCLQGPQTATGRCVELCTGGPATAECSDNGVCLLGPDTAFGFCAPSCDPQTQTCDPGMACVASPGTGPQPAFFCFPEAAGMGGGPGDRCQFAFDCAVNHVCWPGDDIPGCREERCCTQHCDLAAGDSDCPKPLACFAFYEDAPVGMETVGVCHT